MKPLRERSKNRPEQVMYDPPPPTHSISAAASPKKAIRALADNLVAAPPELSFAKGDFLYIIREVVRANGTGTQWYEAQDPVTGERGLVPRGFFESFEEDPPAQRTIAQAGPSKRISSPMSGPLPSRLSKPPTSLKVIYAVVMYAFQPERIDELDAKAGDAISVVAYSTREWFIAKPIGKLGGPGLIPISYVQVRDPSTNTVIQDIDGLIDRGELPSVQEWKQLAMDHRATMIGLSTDLDYEDPDVPVSGPSSGVIFSTTSDQTSNEKAVVRQEPSLNHSTEAMMSLEKLMERRIPVDLSGRVTIPQSNYFKATRGGFSDVFEGHIDGISVAIKVLKIVNNSGRSTEWETSLQRRLDREIRVWAALSHPNIIELVGYSNDFNEYPAMVSTWCSDGNAANYLSKSKEISLQERFQLLQGVTNGLHYLHSLKVIHGDLKPANVLIDAQGVARLCDFGLVRLEDWKGPAGMTTTSPYTGTERYKAPELFASSDNRHPTATMEGDIYALACIGLEFVIGQMPYHDCPFYELRNKIEAGVAPARRPTTARRRIGLDGLFWDMLEECWSPYPENRPKVEEVREDLSHLFVLLQEP